MKTSAAAIVCFFLLATFPARAQNQPAPTDAAQSPTPAATAAAPAPPSASSDPVKAADIQRLLEVTGMRSLMQQTMDGMEENIRPNLERSLPPGEYRAKLIDLFFQKFHAKLTIQDFLDMAAAAYDKYLSDDDIKGLTQFYQTPLGQKTLTVLPKLTVELQSEGATKGEQAGRDAMSEVLLENPDLAKALQDAAQGPPTR
ncbi:MAG TPA: DUF2059 domain-containing protein [Candidatus Methylacidiphilales bacterium]|jgi:hypothetical protein|nr:DUF2059 domain-containing protein [Candidatus Methylacidiphilales bacterium]